MLSIDELIFRIKQYNCLSHIFCKNVPTNMWFQPFEYANVLVLMTLYDVDKWWYYKWYVVENVPLNCGLYLDIAMTYN